MQDTSLTRLLATVRRWCAVRRSCGSAAAQSLSPEVEKHIEAAKAAAGTEHAGLFDRVCTDARAS